jgi:hypothetical protein
LSGWQSVITLVKITQTNTSGVITNNETEYSFKGTVQPLSTDQIQLKPEGQRSFEWLQVHCYAGDLDLATNDRVVYADRRYKVQGVRDYSLNGYIEYHLIQDYQS